MWCYSNIVIISQSKLLYSIKTRDSMARYITIYRGATHSTAKHLHFRQCRWIICTGTIMSWFRDGYICVDLRLHAIHGTKLFIVLSNSILSDSHRYLHSVIPAPNGSQIAWYDLRYPLPLALINQFHKSICWTAYSPSHSLPLWKCWQFLQTCSKSIIHFLIRLWCMFFIARCYKRE